MFRNGLLVSTAMTAVALLLSGADAEAQTAMHVAYRDANARFLCNYGHFTVSFASGSSEGRGWLDNTRAAVPVVGRGQTVSHIIVMEAIYRFSRGGGLFSAGIYANKGGHPGKLIARGTGHARYVSSCQQVSISIPRTTLQPNTKYWIGEYVTGGRFDSDTVFWYVNPKEKRNAFVKTYKQSCSSGGQCSTYSQNWTRQTGPGPWFKLK